MNEANATKIVGYARVSADDQIEHEQVDALRQAGIAEIITEKASGIEDRPLLDSLVASLTTGQQRS
jgi:DNA invertase Pin-like site-specific DNA recombinase